MAIFLLAVPKDITESVSAEQRTEAAASVLTRAFEGYSELVGNHYANEPEIKHPGGGVSSSILVWKRKDEKNSVETKKIGGRSPQVKIRLMNYFITWRVEDKP